MKNIRCPECNMDVKHFAKGLCKKCYNRHWNAEHKEICFICGKYKAICTRNKEGMALCQYCSGYRLPQEVCIVCEKIKGVCVRSENGPICDKCYHQDKPQIKENCSVCNQYRLVYTRNETRGALCVSCSGYEAPMEVCVMCQEFKRVQIRNENSEAVCKKCYVPPKSICIICEKLQAVCKRDENNNAICKKCWENIKNNTDEHFRTKNLLRNRVREAFLLYSITGKIKHADEYGIDYEAIIKHLGPCPGERGQYHIDHILPLKIFNFDDLEHIKLAFAPENHQWLTKEENLKKGSKII